MASSAATAGIGLLSAATWGGSDFIGGLGTRRSPALLIVASGHILTLLVLLAVCLGLRLPLPASPQLFYAALGGFEGAFALALFYRALAMGAMGLTAALTGLLTALIPVLFSLLRDGLPTPLTAAGLAMGLTAIWLITRVPAKKSEATAEKSWVPHPFRLLCEKGGKAQHSTTPLPAARNSVNAAAPPTALLLGALAGAGFGAQLILFKMAGSGSILWTMTAARAAGVTAMVLVLLVMPPKGPWRGFWLPGIAAGALDTLGNLLYIQATRLGRLDVAAVVCSLYPGGTILLAAIVLREWPSPRQFAGIALALLAVALLSA